MDADPAGIPAWRLLARLARRQIIRIVVLLAATFLAAYVFETALDASQMRLAQKQQLLRARQAELTKRQTDLAELDRLSDTWRRWQRAGLMQPEDRPAWFERITGIVVGDMPPPGIELAVAEKLGGYPGAYGYQLKAEFSGATEPEILAWIDETRARLGVPSRVEGLVMQVEAAQGVAASPGAVAAGDRGASGLLGVRAILTMRLFRFDPTDVEKTDTLVAPATATIGP